MEPEAEGQITIEHQIIKDDIYQLQNGIFS